METFACQLLGKQVIIVPACRSSLPLKSNNVLFGLAAILDSRPEDQLSHRHWLQSLSSFCWFLKSLSQSKFKLIRQVHVHLYVFTHRY